MWHFPDPPTKHVALESTPHSDLNSAEIERASGCSPGSEKVDGAQVHPTEHSSLSHSDTTNAGRDRSNQSKTHTTQNVSQ